MNIEQIVVEPLSEYLGVELKNVVFEEMAPTEPFIDMMRKLLNTRRFVLIRGQHIEPHTAEAFTANFGPLLDIKRHGSGALHIPGAEWIKVISNGKTPDGQPLGDGNSSAQLLHSDSTSWEAPVGHIAFYCRQTCDPAPMTYFVDMVRVYADLPQAMKDRIANLRAIHHFFARQIEPEIARTTPSKSIEERRIGVLHPLVRRHLGTGAPMLYIPTRHDSLIPGMPEDESLTLLDELWALVNASPHRIGHAMRPDDFIIWDNSATVHGRAGWEPAKTRMMWHISAEGEVPIPFYPRRTLNTIGLSEEEAREINKHMAMVDY
ncbi:MAG: TauD/TfdA family dioxygenase [Novosphingobium sp.]